MTQRKQDKFVVRFYETGLRDQIAETARATQRSMNAEVSPPRVGPHVSDVCCVLCMRTAPRPVLLRVH